MTPGDAPLFLIGGQRSGTTALGMAIAASLHAEGHCFTVNGRLPYLLERWCTERDVEQQHLRADDIAASLRRAPALGPGADFWQERATAATYGSAARVAARRAGDCLAEARRICREAYGSAVWGDKYNEYLLQLPYLLRLFPCARFVFLTRHPSPASRAMLAWPKEKVWNPRSAESCVLKWASWNAQWIAVRSDIDQGRRLELSYSRLVCGEHAGIDEFVGTDVSSHLRNYVPQVRQHIASIDEDVARLAAPTWNELIRLGVVDAEDPQL